MIKIILKAPIHFYRLVISPWLGPRCRFHPTCSSYTLEALERHGAVKGLVLGIKRICRCHPYHQCAHEDAVPEMVEWGDIVGYNRIRNNRRNNVKDSHEPAE